MKTIPSWSYSRLLDFETCPYRAYLKIIERVPEAKSEAAERGVRIHDHCERYVDGRVDEMIPEMKKFEAEFKALRTQYKAGKVSLEGEWALKRDWTPTEWSAKDAWCRMKLDACVTLTHSHAVVIDHKSGRKFGNEIKHAEQGQLYALGVAMRYPKIESISVEFWYLDVDDILEQQFTREEVIKFLKPFDTRANKMTTAVNFPPNPNAFSCKWCSFSPRKGGQCKVGV